MRIQFLKTTVSLLSLHSGSKSTFCPHSITVVQTPKSVLIFIECERFRNYNPNRSTVIKNEGKFWILNHCAGLECCLKDFFGELSKCSCFEGRDMNCSFFVTRSRESQSSSTVLNPRILLPFVLRSPLYKTETEPFEYSRTNLTFILPPFQRKSTRSRVAQIDVIRRIL